MLKLSLIWKGVDIGSGASKRGKYRGFWLFYGGYRLAWAIVYSDHAKI